MKRVYPFLILFLFTNISSAQVEITEIMYDPSGSDTNREWIEVHNIGGDIDFTKWKFFEANVNHSLASSSSAMLSSGSYAVVVQKKETFLEDYPAFTGIIFDSSFSLINTGGESLAIKNDAGVVTDNVSYDASIGAGGDGTSLQKIGGGWTSASPTPGRSNDSTGSEAQSSGSQSVSGEPPTVSGADLAAATLPQKNFPTEPRIFAFAGQDIMTISGASVSFEGKSLGLKKEPLDNARYLWIFGDGGEKEGQKVEHSYRYPGKYVAVLEVSSGEFSASDRLSVEVLPPSLSITSLGDSTNRYIEINNSAPRELNLGGMQLKRNNGGIFVIPKYTYILPGKKLIFPEEVIGIMATTSAVSLLYQNGVVVSELRWGESPRGTEPVTAATIAPQEKVTKVTAFVPKPKKEEFPKEAGKEEFTAAVGVTPEARDTPVTPFLAGLLGFVVLTGAGMIFLPRRKVLVTAESEADEYEIIEYKEEK